MADSQTALILVDVQEAMFSYPGIKLHDEEGVMERIVSLLGRARRSGTTVIFIQHTEDQEYTKGLPTWQISSRVTPLPGEKIIEKPTWDAFHLTELHEELQRQGITHLIIAGMQSEFCLDSTCRRAFSLGYSTVLVQDAHSTFDNGRLSGEEIVRHHNGVLGGRFVTLKPASEVIF
ncbi:nicotinamidase-related amidase [Paenibacillus forsythiae]|uniref:Nicotinamidase-related amidase n=1 Tax=Paenibacillus forsythiae TaxID=365616 RepID=A0ABU3H686_9BACL|nr:cysteine hydrolase family protein [Paenibacillus forsythiae]MDT3426333.1 nicotinamidase-related amidase [Paenibacillus forsythiae]